LKNQFTNFNQAVNSINCLYFKNGNNPDHKSTIKPKDRSDAISPLNLPSANSYIKSISNSTFRRKKTNSQSNTNTNKPINTFSKNEIQNITASCLYLAAKYEEIYPPDMEYFAKIPQKDMSNY
jgi:hypothetical protein